MATRTAMRSGSTAACPCLRPHFIRQCPARNAALVPLRRRKRRPEGHASGGSADLVLEAAARGPEPEGAASFQATAARTPRRELLLSQPLSCWLSSSRTPGRDAQGSSSKIALAAGRATRQASSKQVPTDGTGCGLDRPVRRQLGRARPAAKLRPHCESEPRADRFEGPGDHGQATRHRSDLMLCAPAAVSVRLRTLLGDSCETGLNGC